MPRELLSEELQHMVKQIETRFLDRSQPEPMTAWRALFGDFTVLQNVMASFYLHPKSSWRAAFFNTATYRRNERQIGKEALAILDLLGLEKAKDILAKNLPHGYQKMLGIARALATRPKLLLLDEPSLGLAPKVVSDLAPVIKNINSRGVSVLLVEQSIPLFLRVAQWGYALQVGRVVMDADIGQFKSGLIRKAYLGG